MPGLTASLAVVTAALLAAPSAGPPASALAPSAAAEPCVIVVPIGADAAEQLPEVIRDLLEVLMELVDAGTDAGSAGTADGSTAAGECATTSDGPAGGTAEPRAPAEPGRAEPDRTREPASDADTDPRPADARPADPDAADRANDEPGRGGSGSDDPSARRTDEPSSGPASSRPGERSPGSGESASGSSGGPSSGSDDDRTGAGSSGSGADDPAPADASADSGGDSGDESGDDSGGSGSGGEATSEEASEDSSGKDSSGKDSSGKDSSGEESGGEESSGEESGGEESSSGDEAGEGAGADDEKAGSGARTPAGTTGAAEMPADLLDLQNWFLTLPIGPAGDPDSIDQPELLAYTSEYFALTPERDGVVFRAPAGGVTTENSKYPRSELREMNGEEKAAWSNSTGTHVLETRQAITEVPPAKPEVVAAQIHDGGDDVMQIRLEGQTLVAQYADGQEQIVIDPAYQLGTPYDLRIVAADSRVTVFYNGEQKAEIPRSGTSWYWKIGAYIQSNPEQGDAAEAVGEVVVYSLAIEHTGT